MARFNQQGQTVGSQINSERADLRDAAFNSPVVATNTDAVIEQLRGAIASLRQASRQQFISPESERSVAENLAGAIDSLSDGDRAGASSRISRAADVLKAASPLAAIAAAVVSAWNSVGGVG